MLDQPHDPHHSGAPPVLHLLNATGDRACPHDDGPTAPADAIPHDSPPLCWLCALAAVGAVAEQVNGHCSPGGPPGASQLLQLLHCLATTPPAHVAAVMLIMADAVGELAAFRASAEGAR